MILFQITQNINNSIKKSSIFTAIYRCKEQSALWQIHHFPKSNFHPYSYLFDTERYQGRQKHYDIMKHWHLT